MDSRRKPEPERTVKEKAVIIRPTMRDGRGHADDRVAIDRLTVDIVKDSRNPTHRGQRSGVRGQQERSWSVEHAAEHLANFQTNRRYFLMLNGRDVAAILRKIQRRIRFAILSIAIGKLAKKMRFISPLGPRFAKVQTYRP